MHKRQVDSGDCFVVSSKLMYTPFFYKNSKLVHGFIKVENHSLPIVHAWIEMNDTIYDYSNGKKIEIDKKTYYEKRKIDPSTCVYYTFKEFLIQSNAHNNYGPWDPIFNN